MARRLSNMEWATFLHEVDIAALKLPPWGGIVEWNSMLVLVYIGPSGEVFLTDLTGNQQFVANFQRNWDATSSVFWYHIPRETMAAIVEGSKGALVATQAIVKTVGDAAGSLTSPLLVPLLKELRVPIVIALVILAFIYLGPLLVRAK